MGEGSFAYRLLDSKENVRKKYEIVAESAFSSSYASFFVLNRMKKVIPTPTYEARMAF